MIRARHDEEQQNNMPEWIPAQRVRQMPVMHSGRTERTRMKVGVTSLNSDLSNNVI